jgi:hypothetical protein
MHPLRSWLLIVLGLTVGAGALASAPLSAFQRGARAPGAPPVRDPPAARPPATGSGTIAGVVLSTETEPRPVRRARVTLSQTEQGSLVRLLMPTDDAGRFSFSGLPAGRYSLSANLPGWVTGDMGMRTPGGQGLTVALTDGQQIENVRIVMARGAVIAGRVVDDTGQPAVGARVNVTERRMVNGVPTSPFGLNWSLTDDRGEYRAFGLRAGTYVVSVTPAAAQGTSGRVITPAELRWVTAPPAPGTAAALPPPSGPTSLYAQVFYPGTTDANAAGSITVAAGEERDGIDVSLQLVRTVKLSGTVTGPDGQRASGAQVLVGALDRPMTDPFSMIRNFLPRGAMNGEFSFTDLQPGRYTISARAASSSSGRGAAPVPAPAAAPPGPRGRGPTPPVLDLWATADITVMGDDIEGLSLVLQPGMTVSGRVVFEGETPPPDLARVSVRLTPPPTAGPTITTSSNNAVQTDGAFTISGLSPGPYDVNAFAPGTVGDAPSWMLKSVVAGGRHLVDGPVEIQPNGDISNVVVTFTDKVTGVTGLLLDQAGRPAPEFYVIVFPTDPTRWAQRSRWMRPPVRPASDGRYRIHALPPGEYYLAALAEFDQNEWFTPGFLEQVVPGAIRITIGEGEKKTQDVRLGI